LHAGIMAAFIGAVEAPTEDMPLLRLEPSR